MVAIQKGFVRPTDHRGRLGDNLHKLCAVFFECSFCNISCKHWQSIVVSDVHQSVFFYELLKNIRFSFDAILS